MKDRKLTLIGVAVILAIVAAACAGAEEAETDGPAGGLPLAPPSDLSTGFIIDGGISVDEALADEGTEALAVSGFVVIVEGESRLCTLLAESFPPQCGGSSLVIENPEALVDLPLVEEGNTQWSNDVVVLLGTVDAGVITVSATSMA